MLVGLSRDGEKHWNVVSRKGRDQRQFRATDWSVVVLFLHIIMALALVGALSLLES